MTDEQREKQEVEAIQAEYAELAHAMQSGVAAMMNFDPAGTSPKHLRVGVNSALVDSGALAWLLIAKGIITEREYFTALRDKMREEVQSFEKLLSGYLNGKDIHLR